MRNQRATKECSTHAAEGAELGQGEEAQARHFVCTAPVGVKTALPLSVADS